MHSSASLQESRLNFLRENQRVLLCFQWPASTTVNHEISAAKLSNTVAMLHQTWQASSKVAAPISLHHSFATSIFSCPMMHSSPAHTWSCPIKPEMPVLQTEEKKPSTKSFPMIPARIWMNESGSVQLTEACKCIRTNHSWERKHQKTDRVKNTKIHKWSTNLPTVRPS